MMMTLYTDDGQVIIIMYIYTLHMYDAANFVSNEQTFNGRAGAGMDKVTIGLDGTVGSLQLQTNQKRLKLIFTFGSPRVKSCLSSHVRSSERGKGFKALQLQHSRRMFITKHIVYSYVCVLHKSLTQMIEPELYPNNLMPLLAPTGALWAEVCNIRLCRLCATMNQGRIKIMYLVFGWLGHIFGAM